MKKPFRPLVPEDLNTRRKPANPIHRAAAAFLRAHVRGLAPEQAYRQLFGNDQTGEAVLRAATTPATTTDASWVGGALAHATVSQTVIEMATASAAASLIAAGMRLNFDRYATIHAPG